VLEDQPITIEVVELPFQIGQFDLVCKYLKLRKEIFIDRMAWPLGQHQGIEFDQYDTFDTTYVIAHRNREVVGGARVKRTDKGQCNGRSMYEYMIRDAHLGLLPGMPQRLCNETPPISRDAWELTRLVALPIRGLAENILEAANDYLFRVGAKGCLFLGPPAFLRMAERLGWTPKKLGDVVENADGKFLAFACAVRAPQTATASPS
jgi:acyl homoserine lactone synthase